MKWVVIGVGVLLLLGIGFYAADRWSASRDAAKMAAQEQAIQLQQEEIAKQLQANKDLKQAIAKKEAEAKALKKEIATLRAANAAALRRAKQFEQDAAILAQQRALLEKSETTLPTPKNLQETVNELRRLVR